MKSDLADKIRSNLITQALIVVLCLTFSNNRLSQTADIDELENLYVTQTLMTATVGEVFSNDAAPETPADPASARFLEARSTGNSAALDAFAATISAGKPTAPLPTHRIALPAGGWLRFHADVASFKTLGPPPAGSSIPLYELTMIVTADSDLHQQTELRIVFTNAEQSVHPLNKTSVWEPMPLRAGVSGQDEPMATSDIEGLIRLKARDWSGANGPVDSLYSSARYSYENEEINIPVVNIQVSASMALAAIALVATALCAYMTYQCRQSISGTPEPAEPHQGIFILKPKDGTVPPGAWHALLAHAEIWFVQPPYWIGLLSPVICTAILGLAHADITFSWLGWALLPFAVGYVWLLSRSIVGVSWTRTPSTAMPTAAG